MTEEVRITYKRRPGAGPNHPPEESDLPADAYIAPCNNCGEWFLESALSKTAEVTCRTEVPRFLSRSRRMSTSSVRALLDNFTEATK